MQSKLILSYVFTALLINSINCQQMVNLLRSAASSQSQSQSQPQQHHQQQQQQQHQQQQQQQGQPQLLSLEQQQQLLQQLAALTEAHQRQQQPSPYGQQQAAQQFFDPSQPPFFGPQGGQAPPNQFFAPQQFVVQPQPTPAQPPAQAEPSSQGPSINWGKCPQLEPSDKEKMTKAQVITKCLETTPLPNNITRETVELHREQIAACALQSEGWFATGGKYDFTKAETEIKNKKLNKQIEDQVLNYHKQCKEESEEKFPFSKSTVIAQIQLYQACMDYFISDVCGIEVNEPESPQLA